jgi:hypothetical protein
MSQFTTGNWYKFSTIIVCLPDTEQEYLHDVSALRGAVKRGYDAPLLCTNYM